MDIANMPDQPSPFADEAEWRLTLPIEVRSVAERYGRMQFALAWNVGAIQEATVIIMRRVRGNNELTGVMNTLVANANSLVEALVAAYEIDNSVIQAIQLDIKRAFALAGIANRPGGKIILPN